MHRILVVIGMLALTLNMLATPASADPVKPPYGWEPIPPPLAVLERSAGGPRATKAMKGPPMTPMSHDALKVDAAVPGASVTTGPHENWLSIDYAASTGADTLYWSNNKGASGTATSLGSYPLYTVTNGCPGFSTSFASYSHTEYAVKILATVYDGLGSPWTIENQYWHLGSYSTGTKANGASFGTQATHPIGGCKYYYAPGTGYHGNLASTGPHIHHYAVSTATGYETSPVRLVWLMFSH